MARDLLRKSMPRPSGTHKHDLLLSKRDGLLLYSASDSVSADYVE